MRFINSLEKNIRKYTSDFSKPDSFIKDKEFETYVETIIFPDSDFKLVSSKRCTCDTKKCYNNCRVPIFKFEDRQTNKQFYVEVQWRNEFYNELKVSWCNESEFTKLKMLHNNGADVL